MTEQYDDFLFAPTIQEDDDYYHDKHKQEEDSCFTAKHNNANNNFTDEELREEMRDFVLRLEEQDASLREARRQYLLEYLRVHKGIDIIAIEGNVVYYKKAVVVSNIK
jgi:hypothetical protein